MKFYAPVFAALMQCTALAWADENATTHETGLQRDLPPQRLVPFAGQVPPGAAGGYPPAVSVRASALGLIYVDAKGRTLYAVMPGIYGRYQFLQGGAASKFCTASCAERWSSLIAPADAKPIGAWKVVEGVSGPQWAYGNSPVFTFSGDTQPGDLNGHEYDDAWVALSYIPPEPHLAAPPNVSSSLAKGEYLLTDLQKRPLYVLAGGEASATCFPDCGDLLPLIAGMTNRRVGEWSVSREGDRLQWTYRGKLVYVASTTTPTDLPEGAVVLRP